MKIQTKILIFVLALTCRAQAQPGSIFRLGMSIGELTQIFGSPLRYHMGGYDFKSIPVVATGTIWSIYGPRATPNNEYEIWVTYSTDSSQSRLHPTLRVSEVRFVADHARPMKEMLSDIAEVSDICSGGCRILVDNVLGYGVYLVSGTAQALGNLRDSTTGRLVRLDPSSLEISEIDISWQGKGLDKTMTDTHATWRPQR